MSAMGRHLPIAVSRKRPLADMIGVVRADMMATAWMTAMVFGFVWLESLTAFYRYAIAAAAGVVDLVIVGTRLRRPPRPDLAAA
jgi:hypothetical protein